MPVDEQGQWISEWQKKDPPAAADVLAAMQARRGQEEQVLTAYLREAFDAGFSTAMVDEGY
jgi:hypothetical protein